MQHLAAQVCDHEAEIWGLHEQTFSLQQEVDQECCHADKVETELRIIEWMRRRASKPSTLNYRTPHQTFHFTSPCPPSPCLPPLSTQTPSPPMAFIIPPSSVTSLAMVHLPPTITGPHLGRPNHWHVPHPSPASPSSKDLPIPWSPSP